MTSSDKSIAAQLDDEELRDIVRDGGPFAGVWPYQARAELHRRASPSTGQEKAT